MLDIELVIALIAAISLGISAFATNMLAYRLGQDTSFVYRPLFSFFLVNSLLEISNILQLSSFAGLPYHVQVFFQILVVPELLLLPPLFWLYVRALTSKKPMPVAFKDFKHILPSVLGGLFLFGVVFLPSAKNGGFGSRVGENISTLDVLTFSLVIFWVFQCCFYMLKIIRRLVVYRSHLMNLFASTEALELRWIKWIGVLLGSYWLLQLTSALVAADGSIPAFDEPYSSLISLALIWVLAVWGLRQKPGLLGELAGSDFLEDKFQNDRSEKDPKKYKNSALSVEQLKDIAAKLEAVMTTEKIYNDPNLSLRVLAKHIGVLPNYVSQALNGELRLNFFDFVNNKRVEVAKELLKSNDETVLSIAYEVGFNSRSSFYTAFKKVTGQTPVSFRKNHH